MDNAVCFAKASTRERRSSAIYRSTALATPNYSYEKRQRELAKKRKNEEKLQKKKHPGPADGQSDQDSQAGDAPTGLTPGSAGSAATSA